LGLQYLRSKTDLAQLDHLDISRLDNICARLLTLYDLDLGSEEVLNRTISFRLIEILSISSPFAKVSEGTHRDDMGS